MSSKLLLFILLFATIALAVDSFSIRNLWRNISPFKKFMSVYLKDRHKLYSHYKSNKFMGVLRIFKDFYEEVLLEVPQPELLIQSQKYWSELTLFKNDPDYYMQFHGLDKQIEKVKKEAGKIPRIRVDQKELAEWVFILNYITNKAEANEVRHLLLFPFRALFKFTKGSKRSDLGIRLAYILATDAEEESAEPMKSITSKLGLPLISTKSRNLLLDEIKLLVHVPESKESDE